MQHVKARLVDMSYWVSLAPAATVEATEGASELREDLAELVEAALSKLASRKSPEN